MLSKGPMTRLLAQRTFRTVIGLLALVEAIFLAESFTTLLEETVRNGGNALDLAFLLLLKSPEIIDFALPLALMLGLYFAITGARDDNELVICAAAGVPWTRIPTFAATIGILGLIVSLLFSGILTPLSSYALRLSLYDLTANLLLRQIDDPGQRNILRTIEGRTVIATPSPAAGVERGNLFTYRPEANGGWRVNQANDWSVVGPDAAGGYAIEMRTFRESSGNVGDNDATQPRQPASVLDLLSGMAVTVNTVKMAFRIDDLIKAADTVRREHETLIFQLVVSLASSDLESEAAARKFGELLARALLCPIAALLAVAAAAWSARRIGQLIVLPGAAALILAADILGRTALGDAAVLGGSTFWTTVLGFCALGLGAPLAYVLWRAELIITPRRSRA